MQSRAEIIKANIEEYTCSLCGVTLKTCHHWGPRCKKAGRRVCAECCYRCEHHVAFSGTWHCSYITEKEKREIRLRRAQERFDTENAKISAAFHKERKEKAREWAIKKAKQRAKAEKAGQG